MILDIKNKILLDNTVQSKVACVVYQFKIGDVEDPEIYAAEPLWKWQQSEEGKWVMSHAVETPSWYRIPDVMQYGYRFEIRAKLTGARLTEYMLRHGK